MYTQCDVCCHKAVLSGFGVGVAHRNLTCMQKNVADGHLGSKEALFLPGSTGEAAKTSSYLSSAVMLPQSLVTKHASHLHGFVKMFLKAIPFFILPVLSRLSCISSLTPWMLCSPSPALQRMSWRGCQ